MNLSGKNVLVVGLARSGMAAIKVLHKLGANITLSETKKAEELAERDTLEELGVEITDQSLDVASRGFDLCVKNPGVPYRGEFVKTLEANGTQVITEIELAYCVAKPQHYYAVTGTNGKTTTSTLTYEILRKAFPTNTHLCGNIGTPLCEIVMNEGLMEEEGHHIVLEISNFQLVNIDKFRPDAAVILNLTPDHVDFMGSLENYYKSKTEVYRNMEGSDLFILNADDALIKEYVERYPVKCNVQSFSVEKNPSIKTDNFVDENNLYIAGEKVMLLDSIHLPGKHNLQNVMASVAIAKYAGVDNKTITEAVSNFTGVEHRIEFVRELNGVRYYNDSKGTNTDATITALKAFDHGVILLLGGYEKGLAMDGVKASLGCVKKVIGFGVCGKRLVEETIGFDNVNGFVVTTLDEAVEKAVSLSESGDTVLLSPSTSSFDQYTCFEERGEHFKKLVNAL